MQRTTVQLSGATMSSPEEAENINMMFHHQHSFITSKIIFTASELGVFDLLRESGELLSSATVAERLKTSLTGMQMLLEACVGLKVLKVEWKEGKGLYGNTEFADLFLAKSSSKSQYYSMKFYSEILYPAMQYLPEAVRDGKSQILSIFDKSSKEFYGPLYSSMEGIESFLKFMSEAWSLYGKDVVSAFDLSGFQLICDVGGSSGGLAKELVSVYPNCTVKLFDLPGVVEISKKYNAFSDDSQISFHEGDFFNDPIPEADLYIISRVLYNWSDEKCIQLLTKVFTACKPGGGVLAVDPIIDDKICGSLPAHLYCIIMLVISEGKSRKESEHRMLFQTAGFKDIQFKKGNIYDVLLARK
ncbi:acetylserotonin O-methyltransferase-like [Thamnophis elegans]|uniref:acetylserotonin O-methyltransferase-like n=1 Tax=Thamnophis elegans TaxID=35005 RepID=UPI001378AAA9|nr:acetylserotonin O-methyltransferase-like [Thamnophis elegans]XP_032081974.1 acetylserotonin O-methyltransferase-like [Thamnophis elegans]XP_032081977.1 acetylserotonin O-methyltransferase-like [Thamnophis elegans]